MTDTHSETKQEVVAERPLIVDVVDRLRNLHLGRRARRLHLPDLIVIGIVIAAIVAGLLFLARQTALNREYVEAKAITDQIVNSIAHQDTAAIRRLGTKQFQSDFDKADLSDQLRRFAAVYKDAKPVVDGRLISNSDKRQYTAITYRYDLLKVPFYIRVDVVKPAGSNQWQVQAIGTGHNSVPDDGSDQSTQAV